MRTEEKFINRTRNRYRRLDSYQQLFLLLVICLTILLGTIICTMPENTTGLADAVTNLQKHSGVESPVTAVLLNFRGYDTLLEVNHSEVMQRNLENVRNRFDLECLS